MSDRLGAAGAAFAATVLTSTWTLGGNAVVYPLLGPELIAWALVLPALRLFMEERFVASALLIGAASWFQLLAGWQTALVLGLVALWRVGADRPAWRERALDLVRFGGAFSLLAAPMVALVLASGSGSAATVLSEPSLFRIIAELRLPHHYLPLSFGPDRYVRFGLLGVAGAAGFLWLRRAERLRHAAFVARFLAVIGGVCGFAFVFTEAVPVLFIAQLQLFKLTVLAQALLTTGAVLALAQALPEQVRAVWQALTARTPFSVLAYLAVLGAAAATVVLAVGGVGRPGAHVAADADREAVHAWAREATPPDALFLVPPSDTRFRMGARRSVAINFKPTPFDDALMREWFERLRTVAPAPLPARGGPAFAAALDSAYHAHTAADWRRLGERFDADYALLNRRVAADPPADPAFAAGDWAVYPLRPPSPKAP